MVSTRLVKQYRFELIYGVHSTRDQCLIESCFDQFKLKQGSLGRGATNIVQFLNLVIEDTSRVVYNGVLNSII